MSFRRRSTPRLWRARRCRPVSSADEKHAYEQLAAFDKGGRFAAWEQPKRLTEELRTGFRSLR
jgi:hypothetical protein